MMSKKITSRRNFWGDTEHFDENGKKMREELAPCCDKLRMLGSFRYPAVLA